MRRASKIDRNQPEIVAALRRAGATVQPLHTVGGGCPDLLVGFRGVNFIIEVKDWQAARSDRELNPAQVEWHDGWKGTVHKVETVDAALAVIGVLPVTVRGTVS